MSENPGLRTEQQDGVVRLTLARPDRRNALTRELLSELHHQIQRVARTPGIRLLILAADGPAFCAGMDLAQMQERARMADARHEWREDARIYVAVLSALWELTIPTLCVVQGPAVAGGVGLVVACDLVVASDQATFALPEPQRGITAAVVTPLLVQRIGLGAAGWILLSGEKVTAADASRFGLCHQVVPAARLAQRVQGVTDSVLTGSPLALLMTRQMLRACAHPNLHGLFDLGMQISADARETSDAREGIAAFLEKRKPRWQERR